MARTERTRPAAVVITVVLPDGAVPHFPSISSAVTGAVPPGSQVMVRTEPWDGDDTTEVEGEICGVRIRSRIPASATRRLLETSGPFEMPWWNLRPVRDPEGKTIPGTGPAAGNATAREEEH